MPVDGVVARRRELALEDDPAPQCDSSGARAIDQAAPGRLGDEHLVGVGAQVGVQPRLHAGGRLVPEVSTGIRGTGVRGLLHATGVPAGRTSQTTGPVSPVSVR